MASPARQRARLGLSRCHTSPRYAARVSTDGAYLAVASYGEKGPTTRVSSRGQVRAFTRRSRSRLLQLCASVDRIELSKSLLVTLTYPRSYTTESSTWKRHLDVFSKRLARTFPTSSAIWKLEFQKRGAPHYHLIVLGVPFLAREWLSRAWYEVVGSGDERHKRAGTQVARVLSYKKAIAYAAKYVAKVSTNDDPQYVGRYWGVLSRRALPAHIYEWRLSKRGSVRLARAIRGLAKSRSRASKNRRYTAKWVVCRGDRGAILAAYAAIDGIINGFT